MDKVQLEIDWFAELVNGGNTSLALGVLLLALVGFTVERLMCLRRRAICPHGLVKEVLPLWHEKRFDEILEKCRRMPSTLSLLVEYVVRHRETSVDLLISGAQDISIREMKAQSQRNSGLAVIASMAPLLGLLGTMIGMIESFKLVELYGDDGGASMLAGAISKALITTAVGLIIAIPSLGVYHFFRHRVSVISVQLEEEFELLINSWLLTRGDESESVPGAVAKEYSGNESPVAVDMGALAEEPA